MSIFSSIFGTHSQRELKKIDAIVDKIDALEPDFQKLSDDELRAKTDEFRDRLKYGETLDDLLPEAFATVREAAVRVLGQRPFRVQLIGGIILHQGRIAEMKTGEGKTITATLPSYLNALSGKGVHIVTVNDYLAKYQGEMMGRLHKFLGITVGIITHDVVGDDRRAAYNADITYGTNNEFGFDYLRDNMALYKERMVQRFEHNFAIVDEVDSILIDEARTPLIISGKGDKSTEMYGMAEGFVSGLRMAKVIELDEKQENEEGIDPEADYIVDEKAKTATLTSAGIKRAENYFNLENLSDPENATISHHINQALKAHGIMHRDTDYIVNEDGQVIIVDEFTGRLMYGRRYSDGLHQAIEAKEHVKVENENKTLATITFQNYFRLYSKLSGMTGTALTEEMEFREIYKLDVVEIPTNRPMIREDHPDVVYKNEAGKLRAVIRQIEECHAKGQPVLVGTVSIEKSEHLSALLAKKGIKHVVLNAKQHAREAEIVAQAGKEGAVTIATNMAGRGTDIMLGGNAEFLAKSELKKFGYSDEAILEANGHGETDNEEILEARAKYADLYARHKEEIAVEAERVRAAGGLYIIGTERHESRRIDNQLRGRSGRQGDPGESRFYLALDDDIMRLFGSERITGMMESLGIDEDTPIEQKMLTNAIESAQKRVESRHFATRKHVLEYDDVMNKQRETIYGQRQSVLNGEDIHGPILAMVKESIRHTVSENMHDLDENGCLSKSAVGEIRKDFGSLFMQPEDFEDKGYTPEEAIELLNDRALTRYEERESEYGSELMREIERVVLLRAVDEHWTDHIDAMQDLRQSVSLLSIGQQDPLVEYKRIGFDMFEEMNESIRAQTVRVIYAIRVRKEGAPERKEVAKVTSTSQDGPDAQKPQPRKVTKVGRNDPCPCGSGKKYKHCCGQ